MKIRIQVKPGRRETRIVQTEEGLVVELAARAIEGEANKALMEALAQYFGVAKTRVKIARGARSKYKTVEITGVAV